DRRALADPRRSFTDTPPPISAPIITYVHEFAYRTSAGGSTSTGGAGGTWASSAGALGEDVMSDDVLSNAASWDVVSLARSLAIPLGGVSMGVLSVAVPLGGASREVLLSVAVPPDKAAMEVASMEVAALE